MKTFLRILIIGAILAILVLLSVGIVRIVPKALSSLASATVSINSLFDGGDTKATTTPVANGNGFVVVNNATSTANATSSILDILKPNFNKYGPNNYVPTPGTNSNTYNRVNGTAAGRNVSTSNNAVACTGNPDIAVSIIGKGVISKTTGQYVETNSFTTNDMVSIKFKVENRGTCSTGTWSLNTTLPSQNTADRTRNVANVASLPAGSAVTGQVNFDMPQAGNVAVNLVVTDTSGKDLTLSNNTAVQNLSVVNTGTTNPGTVPTTGNGQPDLMVRVLQTGVLTYNNQFIPTTNNVFRAGDRVAVKFEVLNQGQTATGAWNFRADLMPNQTYNNPQYEAGIPAGGRAIYTIAFDNVQIGSNTIMLYVDSQNQVQEFNESNNTGSISFQVNY